MSQITPDKDGVYRWAYEYNLYKNPTILFVLYKIFGVMFLIGGVIFIGSSLHSYFDTTYLSESLRQEELIESLTGLALFVVFFFVLITVGYLIYALMQGGKYCVLFTMDENGIMHKQLPRQFEKSQVVSAINVVAGLATASPGQVGIGMITATHDCTISTFESVKSIRGYRSRGVIKVNEPFAKNQVYVDLEDYDFVFDYIKSHCPNATIKG